MNVDLLPPTCRRRALKPGVTVTHATAMEPRPPHIPPHGVIKHTDCGRRLRSHYKLIAFATNAGEKLDVTPAGRTGPVPSA